MLKIYPVIHRLDDAQVMREATLAMEVGADGVFLISHLGDNPALLPLAQRVQRMRTHDRPPFHVGVNLLGVDPSLALRMAHFFGIEMVWMDNAGVRGDGLDANGEKLKAWADSLGVDCPQIFAGTAFKYQPGEPAPSNAAAVARAAGFVPTTSGPGTGEAPTVEKIKSMSVLGSRLACASGMTVENVVDFAPFLSHILVATGVSSDEYHFDFELLSTFIARARAL